MIHVLEFIFLVAPFLCVSVGGGGSPSSSTTQTNTTSGASSPVANESSQAIGSGSIGVAGQDAAYIEQGATQTKAGGNIAGQVGGNIEAGSGSNITIGDPNATATLADLATQFANSVQNVSAGAEQAVAQAAGAQQPWSLQQIGLVIAGLTAVLLIFKFLFGGKRA
jgi:hypothetical protein